MGGNDIKQTVQHEAVVAMKTDIIWSFITLKINQA